MALNSIIKGENGKQTRTKRGQHLLPSSSVVPLGRIVYANTGLNGLCEATAAAKLRLIGRWMCEAAPSLQTARTHQPPALTAA